MLNGLDDVDWAGLEHAYGPADDVPELIRALLSPDPRTREEARHELSSNIYHQGTRYPASAPAVPFLLEVLADPGAEERGELVDLLAALAIGEDDSGWRPFPVAEQRADDRDLTVYDAVAAGVPLFVELATDPDAETAVPAMHALAAFPEHADRSGPVLAAAAADDDAPIVVTTTALLALSVLGGAPDPDALLRRRLADDDDDIRWAAALAASRLRRAALMPDAVAELHRWAARDTTGRPWHGRRDVLALEELADVDPDGHDARLRPILDRMLAESPASNWHNHLLSVLGRAGLLGGDEHRPWDWLNPAQQHLVRQVCDRPEIFADDRAQRPLAWAGLPDTLEGLRAYAAGR